MKLDFTKLLLESQCDFLGLTEDLEELESRNCRWAYDEVMLEEYSAGAVQIDLETWDRSALFHLFNPFSEPFHGVCLRVDCTESFRFAKQSGVSVFLTLVHRALVAANQVENFMTRIVDGTVWRYATIHGGSAVGRPNGTIGFGYYPFQSELLPFVREASVEVERVKARNDLERYAGQDLIRFSVLPWFDFTSISHARNLAVPTSAPQITFGKITGAGDRFTMPLSIHVHHALADGLHVAEFVSHLRDPWQRQSLSHRGELRPALIRTMTQNDRAEVSAAAPRFETVDLLRGLSILAVVLLHCRIRFGGSNVHVGTGLSRYWRHLVFQNGGNGVTIFFAISGFLITLTSLRRFGGLARMKATLFYRIRFARIAPLLVLVLTVLSLLHWGSLHSDAFEAWHVKSAVGLPRALFSAVTFHLNWLEAKTGYLPANWDVMWSLSVEEMFYLFFPLVCLALVGERSPLRRIGWPLLFLLAAVLLVLGPWARSVWISSEIAQEKSYLGGMNAIALGCLTALLCNRLSHSARVSRTWLYVTEALGWILIAWIASWPASHWLHSTDRFLAVHDLDDTVLPLGVCLVMISTVLRGSLGGGALTAPVRWFGRHSYEVYLTHEFLVILGVQTFLRWHGARPGLWTLAITALTAPLGWAVAHWFSEPINRRLRGARPQKVAE